MLILVLVITYFFKSVFLSFGIVIVMHGDLLLEPGFVQDVEIMVRLGNFLILKEYFL